MFVKHIALSGRLSVILRLCLLFAPVHGLAEYHEVNDVKAFGLLDVSGHVKAGYLLDDRERGQSGTGNFENRLTWQEEVFILTESFVYHPGFLKMDFGGGPLFVQQDYKSPSGEVAENDSLFNFVARLNFLDLKRYPFSIYFERSHPSVTTSLAGRFLTRNDVRGFTGRLVEMFGGSTAATVSFVNRNNQGSGFGTVVDNIGDTAEFTVVTNYRTADNLRFKYHQIDQESRSGSAGLPIVQSSIEQEMREVRAENIFGSSGQIRVLQNLQRLQQETTTTGFTEFDQSRYTANLDWAHSGDTRSFLRLRDIDVERTGLSQHTREVNLGLNSTMRETANVNAEIGRLAVNQTGFDQERILARASVSLSKDTRLGNLGITAAARGARTNQESTASDVPVFDEPITLIGTEQVPIANEFVVPGSVVVRNENRTQTYVEGLDYRLVEVGNVTRIQRLVGSAITDGETVLVNYSYETSGTAEFDSLGSTVSVNFGFFSTMNAFARYDRTDTDIREGILTNPTNDRVLVEVGLGTTNQFLDGWTFDGQYRRIENDEEISPYSSDVLHVSFARSILGRFKVLVGASRSLIDYDRSLEDVDQSVYRFGLNGRVTSRSYLSYEGSLLDDEGGTLLRRQYRHRLSYQWTYRQMRFDLQALYIEDELGPSRNSSSRLSAVLTRAF